MKDTRNEKNNATQTKLSGANADTKISEHPVLDTSTFTNEYEIGELMTEVDTLQKLEADEREARVRYLGEHGVTCFSNSVIIRPDRDKITEAYMTESYLVKIGNTFITSHRIEEYVALALRSEGLDAKALPAIVDGNTSNPKADLILTFPCSHELAELGCREKTNEVMQVAIEIKQAKGGNALLGMPITEDDLFAIDGFDYMPRFLWVDSTRAYREKHSWHSDKGVPLIGCIIAAPIGELSDEDVVTLGLVWLPSPMVYDGMEPWTIQTCTNPYKGTSYKAYKATNRREHIYPLCDLVADFGKYCKPS